MTSFLGFWTGVGEKLRKQLKRTKERKEAFQSVNGKRDIGEKTKNGEEGKWKSRCSGLKQTTSTSGPSTPVLGFKGEGRMGKDKKRKKKDIKTQEERGGCSHGHENKKRKGSKHKGSSISGALTGACDGPGGTVNKERGEGGVSKNEKKKKGKKNLRRQGQLLPLNKVVHGR